MKSEDWFDTEQLVALVNRYAGPLELLARQWTTSAEDCVQEAFVRLIGQKKPPDDVVAWLFRVVRNRAIDIGRVESNRRKREREVGRRRWFENSTDSPVDTDALQSALAQIPHPLRQVVVSKIWGELTFEQLAEVFGWSVATAHRRYQEGLKQLKAKLNPSCPQNTI